MWQNKKKLEKIQKIWKFSKKLEKFRNFWKNFKILENVNFWKFSKNLEIFFEKSSKLLWKVKIIWKSNFFARFLKIWFSQKSSVLRRRSVTLAHPELAFLRRQANKGTAFDMRTNLFRKHKVQHLPSRSCWRAKIIRELSRLLLDGKAVFRIAW